MKKRDLSSKEPKRHSPDGSDWLDGEIDFRYKHRGSRLAKRLGSKKDSECDDSPLLWLVGPDVDSETAWQVNRWNDSLINKRKRKRTAEEIIGVVETISDRVEDPNVSLVVLAASHMVRSMVGKCDFADWQQLVTRLLEISEAVSSNADPTSVAFQQLAIELPMVIAYQIPEIQDYQQLAANGCRQMAANVCEMLDHDGWPGAKYLTQFGPLVASWARCHVIVSELSLDDELMEAASQLEWMVRQVLRMLRPERTLVFSESGSAPATEAFFKCLLELSNDPDDRQLLRTVISRDCGIKVRPTIKAIESSNISEWSESALLQSDWRSGSSKVAVDFSNHEIRTEICCGVDLIRGDTTPEISINGVHVVTDQPFEVACIESDKSLDYLELTKDLGKSATLTRQYLLSRTDEFLLIADLVVPGVAARIDYRGNWPLATGVEGMHESETREVYLTNTNSIQSLILPLALPEWKVGRTDDKLDFQKRRLCLTQCIDGLGLYSPLFFDLNPNRSKKKRTWRQLTVAENRSVVPRDEACAFRVQLDKQQWIFYRTVSKPGNRTYLGENVNSEFVFSRFLKNGAVKQLIEVN